MCENLFDRTRMLVGQNGVDALKNSSVLVCGLGGVGGYVFEALCRAGIGKIGVLDNDIISESNLNRQLLATALNIGEKKTEAAAKRANVINPQCEIFTYDLFYNAETAAQVPLRDYDCIIDAIDTVSSKIELIKRAKNDNLYVISCMGTGNKLYTNFEISDIYSTSVCPLARVMRKELKAAGVAELTVVYSKEVPKSANECLNENGRHIPGSISFVPAAAGIAIAGEAVRKILENSKTSL